MDRLQGTLTALVTPFRNEEPDLPALQRFVRHQISSGIHGLVPCGTTGEAATLTSDEMVDVIQTVARIAGDELPVVAGTGSNDTSKTIQMTRRVSQIPHVDAALVVTPYYNKPSQQGLYNHFKSVADQGELPVVLYNVPSRTGRFLEVDTVCELANHENVVAIKEASGDPSVATRLIREVGDEIDVLSGDDFTTLPLMAVGGQGCISVASNVDPHSMSRLTEYALDNQFPEARQLHHQLFPVFEKLFARPNPVPAKVWAHLEHEFAPEVRPPLRWPSESFVSEVKTFIRNYSDSREARK